MVTLPLIHAPNVLAINLRELRELWALGRIKMASKRRAKKRAVRRPPKAEGTPSLQTLERVACTHRNGAAEQGVYVAEVRAIAVALLSKLLRQVGAVKG